MPSQRCACVLYHLGEYIINYSENIPGTAFGQQIRFSTSTDLRTWRPARDVPSFHEQGKYYSPGRWDTVNQYTDAAGTMHGVRDVCRLTVHPQAPTLPFYRPSY